MSISESHIGSWLRATFAAGAQHDQEREMVPSDADGSGREGDEEDLHASLTSSDECFTRGAPEAYQETATASHQYKDHEI